MAFDEPNESIMAQINITPLVDVMLVLLVIFMVTAPILQPVAFQVAFSSLSQMAPYLQKEPKAQEGYSSRVGRRRQYGK